MYNYLVIDPGIKNLCLCFKSSLWLFHFEKIYEIIDNECFNSVLEKISTNDRIVVLCENQFKRNNILTQGILCGYIYNKVHPLRVLNLAPSLKYTFFKKRFGCEYQKIRSNKMYESLPKEFLEYLKLFQVLEIDKSKYEYKSFINYKSLKKKDDLIDCVIMQIYYNKK